MERVERIENLDVCSFRAQGIVSADGITRICIVWFPAADSHPTVPAGSPVGLVSSCPSAYYRACSAACFWNTSSMLSMPANCVSSLAWKSSEIAASLPVTWRLYEKPNGSSMQRRPSLAPSRYSIMSAGIRTASPFPNHRLLDIEAGQVRFQWKDYRDKGQQKAMTLSAEDFIRRFLLHALPDGFQRIRYYGLLGNRYRQQKLARCRELLGMAPPVETAPPEDYRDQHEHLTGSSLRECPACRRGRMVMVETLAPRRSPIITNTS
jgi:Putative transposase